jgi:hypothetical protein
MRNFRHDAGPIALVEVCETHATRFAKSIEATSSEAVAGLMEPKALGATWQHSVQ